MRDARRRRLVAGLGICLAMVSIAAADELPRVRLVATGGTISNRAGGRLTAEADAAPAPGGATTPPRPRRAFIGGEDLQPVKARILLMLALTRTKDPAEIQRMFLQY